MARGGAVRWGNNGGNHTNTGKMIGMNTKNQFVAFDSPHHSLVDESNSLFYLTNGDHLGLSLGSTPLTGSNYNSWCQAMTMALIAKNKIYFVNAWLCF